MAFLEKRKNSRGETIWVIHYRVGKKQKMKTIGKTDKRTAQKVLVQFESQLVSNSFGFEQLKQITIKEFEKEYLELALAEKARATFLRDRRMFKYLLAFLGDVELNSISKKDIERYRLRRLQLVSEETVNLEFRHLKAIFNRARLSGYLLDNPFNKIKPLSVPEVDLPRFLEIEEIQQARKIFEKDRIKDLVEFYLLTGARLKEPLSLTWKEVDFRRNFLKIRSIHTKAKKHRIISFGDDAQLENLLKGLPIRDDNLLFGPADREKPWSHWWVSRKISRMLSKAGFPWASCHTFRQTFISHLIMQGVPLLTVKDIVGHSDISTTMKYAHLAPKHRESMQGRRPY